MNSQQAIKLLEKQVTNPSYGLPKDIFLFVSRIVPMINVDLLIKDEKGRLLLSWRADGCGKGWHIPGGIIRYKEEIKTRIQKVFETEIGLPVQYFHYEETPIAVTQFICDHKDRGHCIGLLIRCFLSSKYSLKNKDLKEKDIGFLRWFESCPSDLLKVHNVYKKYMFDPFDYHSGS